MMEKEGEGPKKTLMMAQASSSDRKNRGQNLKGSPTAIAMTKQFLDGLNAAIGPKQMAGKGVTKRDSHHIEISFSAYPSDYHATHGKIYSCNRIVRSL